VAWSPHNVLHKAIFYTGFLNGPNGEPGGYNQIWNPTYDRVILPRDVSLHEYRLDRAHYVRALYELPGLDSDDVTDPESMKFL
jgi:hypothetical protein